MVKGKKGGGNDKKGHTGNGLYKMPDLPTEKVKGVKNSKMKLTEILEPLKKKDKKSKTPDQKTDLNQKILKKRKI